MVNELSIQNRQSFTLLGLELSAGLEAWLALMVNRNRSDAWARVDYPVVVIEPAVEQS